MTLILNVLHKDMSILAADRKAIAEWPDSSVPDIAAPAGIGSVVNDFNKITLNARGDLALGIAGRTQDHYYTQAIERSVSIDEGLLVIRKHMERFLRVHDRVGLSTLTSFTVNQGIASFFDNNTGMYFSNTYLFSPVRSETRLYRAADEVKIFHVGSGSEHFEKAVGSVDINSFLASAKNACAPEACIPWMQEAFMRVSASSVTSGSEATFVVSTRANPEFRLIERH